MTYGIDRPQILVKRGIIRKLINIEEVRLELNLEINTDLEEHSTRFLCLGRLPGFLFITIVEVTPDTEGYTKLGRYTYTCHVRGQKCKRKLNLKADLKTRCTHNVELEGEVRLFKIDNVGLYASFKEGDREVISLCNARLNLDTCHDIELCRYYEVDTDLKPKNTELVEVLALFVYFNSDNFDPCLVGILHHLGIFLGDVVACIVLFFLFAVDLFIDIVVEFKELL